MNIMHNKTVKLYYAITENDATETGDVSKKTKISANQPAQIRQVPVAMSQQMFEVTATRFHSATKTFAPLIKEYRRPYSAADQITRESVVCLQAMHIGLPIDLNK